MKEENNLTFNIYLILTKINLDKSFKNIFLVYKQTKYTTKNLCNAVLSLDDFLSYFTEFFIFTTFMYVCISQDFNQLVFYNRFENI